ncbi:MAG TPA: peptidoglycan-binding domain-containing protein [Vineibacter sp.]|nr:peptidoglycan-binding domain-containing protein [Vineibacter sp.]
MAHLFVPLPHDLEIPTCFNVDGAVGKPPAQNLREDVLLVQFLLNTWGNQPGTRGGQAKPLARMVRVTGIIDPVTIDAIVAFQQSDLMPQATVDGRVSPAKGRDYGAAIYTIVQLNSLVQDRNLAIWPRIDLIPGTHPEIVAMVIRTVVGV